MAKYLENKLVSLKEAGNDEKWLHKWIAEKPERLGIGPFEIIAQELHQYKNKGGILDILGYRKPEIIAQPDELVVTNNTNPVAPPLPGNIESYIVADFFIPK